MITVTSSRENRHESCGPIVRTERLELVRFVDIDGRGNRGTLGFEADISWIRECDAHAHFEHGDVKVTDSSGYVDGGRFMSCLGNTIEEAERDCQRFSIDAASTLAVVVVAKITEIPVITPIGQPPRAYFGRFEYEAVPKDWLMNRPEEIEAFFAWQSGRSQVMPERGLPRLDAVIVAEERVWNSQLSPAANDRAIAAFKARWQP
jgi:hypothetical protein